MDREDRERQLQSRVEACMGRIGVLEAVLRGMLAPRNASWRAIARDLLAVPQEEWITRDGDWALAEAAKRRQAEGGSDTEGQPEA